MKRGQVYLLRLDPTEASEQAGTRPAVIVSRNVINQYSPLVVICPMTDAARIPKPYPSDVFVKAPEGGLTKDSIILTLQVRAVAKNRFLRFLGDLKPETMIKIEQALKITLNLS
ncbi:MAG: type II toxin-antitoxin system PemK/MazF family toxin [Deltaproteobacteria bacterium]|nr:type II toxin-antitoxin system PemK/MazF family toxin [Deltaproteobacteria bacterium]